MEIRKINESDDLNEISSIYEKSWKWAYKGIIPQDFLDGIAEGKWINHLKKHEMTSFVTVADGRLIGTSSICPSRFECFSGMGEIVSIYFLPEFAGMGYGSLLLEAICDELRETGYNKAFLWVLEDNVRARRFYEKNGFVCTDEVLNDNIGGKPLKEIAYVRELYAL